MPMKLSDFFARVYRGDSMAESSWSSVVQPQADPRPPMQELATQRQRLAMEYLIAQVQRARITVSPCQSQMSGRMVKNGSVKKTCTSRCWALPMEARGSTQCGQWNPPMTCSSSPRWPSTSCESHRPPRSLGQMMSKGQQRDVSLLLIRRLNGSDRFRSLLTAST